MNNQQVTPNFQDAAINLGFDLHSGLSSLRAIQHVQRVIEDEIPVVIKRKFAGKDLLTRCNQIISALGCTPVADENQARIIAKGLAEQLVLQGLMYEPGTAMAIVAGKLVKLEKTMPWCFATKTSTITPTIGVQTGGTPSRVKAKGPKRGGDKKERALAVYDEMKSANAEVKDADIAKAIATKHSDMSFANAYYYVTRVFQKKVK